MKAYIGTKLALAAATTLLLCGVTQADFLLTDNNLATTNGSAVFAADTPHLSTGATYQWVHGESGNVRGNTDANVISTDEADNGYPDMQDNISENAGSYGAVYQTWDGGTGAGSGDGPFAANVATAQFDLQNDYIITQAVVSAAFDTLSSHSAGVSTLEVWLSDSPDNGSFTKWGTWTDDGPTSDDRDFRLTVTGPLTQARYVQFYLTRSGDANSDVANHTYWHQMRIGEMAVFGNPVPEPGSLALLGLGSVLLLSRKRRNV